MMRGGSGSGCERDKGSIRIRSRKAFVMFCILYIRGLLENGRSTSLFFFTGKERRGEQAFESSKDSETVLVAFTLLFESEQ